MLKNSIYWSNTLVVMESNGQDICDINMIHVAIELMNKEICNINMIHVMIESSHQAICNINMIRVVIESSVKTSVNSVSDWIKLKDICNINMIRIWFLNEETGLKHSPKLNSMIYSDIINARFSMLAFDNWNIQWIVQQQVHTYWIFQQPVTICSLSSTS